MIVLTERLLNIGKLQLSVNTRLGNKDNPYLFFGKGEYLSPNKSSFVILGYHNKGNDKEEVYISVLDFPKIMEAIESIDYFMLNIDECTEVVGEENLLRIKSGYKISFKMQMRSSGVCLFAPIISRSKKKGEYVAVKILIGGDTNKILLDKDNWLAFSMQLKNCMENFTVITNSLLTMGLQYKKNAPRESIKFSEIAEE
jgi:hypothetical protein